MKQSKKEPKTGDVFVLQPQKGDYCYGKVIQAKIKSQYATFNGWHLIYVYNYITHDIVSHIHIDNTPLLIAPMIINNRPWTMGYFETLFNSSVTDYDKSIDFGFWDVLRKKCFDIHGNEISRKPYYLGIFGLGSYGAVEKEVRKALDKFGK